MRINVNFKLDGSIKYSLNDACVACGKNKCINRSILNNKNITGKNAIPNIF